MQDQPARDVITAAEADTMTTAAITVASGFTFLESPRWHEDRIWFSDFYTHRVLSAREDGSDLRTEATVPQQPSGLGWLPDGRLLVVSMLDRKILRREPDGTLVTHAALRGHTAGHANDMVVDADGRAWVGNFGFDLRGGAPLQTASLCRVDPDGTVTEAATGLWFPNGSVLTPDRVLVVNETFGNRCTAFDVTPDGRLANRRIWAEFGPLPAERAMDRVFAQVKVAPDGACLDADGALWVADSLGDRLLRVKEGGDILDELRPGSPVFACALGGADGRTLFACVAPDFNQAARTASPEARLLALRVPVPAA
jgi:sugar lactone lactonase YvrE